MATQIQIRRDTADNWYGNNTVLSVGELAYETDTKRIKIGDGSSFYNNLHYVHDPTAPTQERIDNPIYLNKIELDDNKVQINDAGANANVSVEIDGSTEVNISADGISLFQGEKVNAILDEDDMTTNSSTALATQQSIKTYVDALPGSTNIGELLDVTTSGATSGQVLKYNGAAWQPMDDTDTTLILSGESVGSMGDVDITSIADGQILKWNASANKFEAASEFFLNLINSDAFDSGVSTTSVSSSQSIKNYVDNSVSAINNLSNISDYTGGVNITGTASVSGGVDIDIGGSLKMSAGTCDFTHSLVNFSGATVGGLDNSDVNLSNIVDSSQGVNITGTAAVSGGVDISIGGSLTCSAGTVDLTHSLVNFSGANVAGLPGTMNTAVAETGVEVEIIVMVITKTSMHRYNGQGSNSGYTFRINGVDYESPFLDLVPGKTYKFDQGEASNATHGIKFYEDAAKTTPYTTGVTETGTPGTSGAYTSIAVTESTPSILHYQCVNHDYMGNQVQVKGISGGGSSVTVLDEDDFASDSATGVPSQQSTKAYISSQLGSGYTAPPAGQSAFVGGWKFITTGDSPYTAVPGERLFVESDAGPVDIDIPGTNGGHPPVLGHEVMIVHTVGGNPVTIYPDATDNHPIDGANPASITPIGVGATIWLVYKGPLDGWVSIGHDGTAYPYA